MAVSRLNKRSDADLISTNVKQGIDIFGVEGNYGGLNVGKNFNGANAFIVYDNDGEPMSAFTFGKFYDDGTKIICMGYVRARIINYAYSYYYMEINKSTLQVTRYPALYLTATGLRSINTMKYSDVSGTMRYGLVSTSGSFAVYFDGTSVVEGVHSTINAGTTIGSDTIALAGKTLSTDYYESYTDDGSDSFGSAVGLIDFS